MSISSKITYTKSDLKANMILSKAKVSYQEKEIECTLSLIQKFKTIVDHDKVTLNDYIVDRIFLMEEKCYLKSLVCGDIDNGFADYDEENIESYINEDYISNLPKISLFSDVYEILCAPKSENFYKVIISRLSDCYPCKEVFYQNQTLIPNELKISTAARKMILYRISNVGEYPLNVIICRPVTMCLDLHISSGSGEILSIRGKEAHAQYHVTEVTPKMSYFILQSQTTDSRFVLLANTVPMLLAIELFDPVVTTPVSQPPDLSAYSPVPSSDFCDHQISYIRPDLSLKEIRNRILFVDAHFGETVTGVVVPLRLSVVDYRGTVLLDTLLCPRSQIRNYCTDEHGISETDLIGTADAPPTLDTFHRLTWDNILVGHDLKRKLAQLKVNMAHVCGVRELQASVALQRLMQTRTHAWSLKSLFDKVMKNNVQKMPFSAQYTAHIVRNIYIAVESQWRDSLDDERLLWGTSRTTSDFFGAKNGFNQWT